MTRKPVGAYLEDVRTRFEELRMLCDGALAQVDDKGFFAELDEDANSLAVLVKHMAGNMRSRWSDFLHSDGEKPDRDRDGEFLVENESRRSLMKRMDKGWHGLFDALDGLVEADLGRTVLIRGEEHTVVGAINRQLSHYGYHTGQIVQLARHHRKGPWHSLSIPRGASGAFNAALRDKHGSS